MCFYGCGCWFIKRAIKSSFSFIAASRANFFWRSSSSLALCSSRVFRADCLYCEGEKKTQEGGVELCFQKLFRSLRWRTVLRFRVWSNSESAWVQSRVQRIEVKNRERKNTSNYTGSFHKPEVVLSSLHFQGEFH